LREELLHWLASVLPEERDRAVEARFGIGLAVAGSDAPPGEHLVGYHAAGVAPIVRALLEVPVEESDVVVDLGAGLGKVLLLARLLTGARVRGIELQPALAERARAAAHALAIDVELVVGDARDGAVPIDDATVFFLYVPFTGPALARVLERLEAVAKLHPIVVCTLGLDLHAPWLRRRPLDAFWLEIYDSAEPRAPRSPVDERAVAIAEELRAPSGGCSRSAEGAAARRQGRSGVDAEDSSGAAAPKVRRPPLSRE
jgi:SAM-dependent methyltransferase